MNIFDVVLVDSTMPLPHGITQLEPNLLFKFDAYIALQVRIPWSVVSISLCPSIELLHGQCFAGLSIHWYPDNPFVDSLN